MKAWILIPPTPSFLQRRRYSVMVIFCGLALLYMMSSPILEVSDEASHFAVIDYIARTGELPYQDPNQETLWKQEGSQPPLYYLMVAGLVAPIDRSDHDARQFNNPHAKIGIALAHDNQNMIVHDNDAEAFPWRKTTLAVMIGRLFSLGCGLMTLWGIFVIGRLTIPQSPMVALLAMLITAFNPMFVYITASVNNDNLVIALGTWMLIGGLSLYRNGWNWRTITVLSVLGGMAGLTKLSGLTFLPSIGLLILFIAWRDKHAFRQVVVAGLIMSAGVVVIAGWWYLRNIELYGDPTGLNRMVEIAGERPHDFGLNDLWEERESFYSAYWGWFGGVNILSPAGLYRLGGILLVIGGIGVLWKIIAVPPVERLALLWLGLQWLVIFIGVVRWSLQTPASQGRLIFPAMGAISVLMAAGIVFWIEKLPSIYQRWGVGAFLAMPLGIYALVLPFTVIQPAYRPDVPIETLPSDIQRVDVQYGGIQFLGYQIQDMAIDAAQGEKQEIAITLYWRPIAHTATPLSFFVQVYAPEPNGNLSAAGEIGKIDSFPSRGLRRTDTWALNEIYRETYTIEIENAARFAPFEPRFKIGWRDNQTDETLLPTTMAGEPLPDVIVQGGSVYRSDADCVDFEQGADVQFGNLAQLISYRLEPTEISLGGTVEVYLRWRVIGETEQNYSVFVQLLAETPDGLRLYASGDNIPRQQRYPTRAWVKDTCFEDAYILVIPSDTPVGTYQVWVGFYEGNTRLSLDRGGDAYPLSMPIVVTESIE